MNMMHGLYIVGISGLLLIGSAYADPFSCVMKTGGEFCTILPTNEAINASDATIVDPTKCLMLQRIPTYQFCNRLGRTNSSCLTTNCNNRCKRFYIDNCKCDILIVGPVKNDCMARYQADYIAFKMGIPADQIQISNIPNYFCDGKPRATVEKYKCSSSNTNTTILCA